MQRHFLFALLMLSAVSAAAQTGFPPYGSFAPGGFDTVNRENLNVNFSISMVSVPGRGTGFNFPVVYDSLVWKKAGTAWVPADGNWGWKTDVPVGSITFSSQLKSCLSGPKWDPWHEVTTRYYNYVYTDPNGTAHGFPIDFHLDATNCNYPTSPSSGYATDGSGFLMYGGPSPEVIGPNGVNVTGGGVARKDTNGNFISKIIVSSTETHWKDTRGIVVLKIVKKTSPNCGGFAECVEYKYADAGGTERTVTLNYTTQWNVRPNFACGGISEPTYNSAKLLREIVFPNGLKYVFDYEDGAVGYKTGRISKVTLPTGGFYEYVYPGPNNGINCADGKMLSMDRKIGEQGSGSPSTWQYRRTFFNPDWKTKITEPAVSGQVANESTFVFDVGGKLKTARIHQGPEVGGTLLRTTNIVWAANGTPFSTTAVLEEGPAPKPTSKVETDFDTYGNLLETREFDFANNLVRKTTNTHTVIGSFIRDRVTSTTVRDGVGNVKAKTEIFYDEPGYINVECPANVPQHDDATHGCSATARGNPTTIRRWVNASQYVHNSPKYDSLGNVLSVTDTALHVTTFDYADSWAGPCAVAAGTRAFPKKVTNHLGHATTFTYNNCTGAVVSATDPNNQTTSFAYDWAGRPVQSNRPDGGQTLWHYEDTARYIRMKTLRAAGAYVVNYSYFDTLGRLFREDLCEDGTDQCTSPVKAEITYDAVGRQATVTNPYRSTSDPTYGISETRYDALGRVTKVIPPDGTVSSNNVTATFAGNCTTVTDQAGKQRRSCADALGRLIQVDEPNPTLSTPAVTTYTYDTLDNLLSTLQSGSRQRTFTYDWLSRPLTANHPESGTTTYVYEGPGTDSLLQTITDARGIGTTHSYDALHRLTQKSYSDGSTPNLFFSYDVAPPWLSDLTNVVGRLVEARNQYAGSPSSTTASSVVNSYDAVGRVVRQWQQTPSASPGGHFVHYGYDLAGNLTSLTYPSGRKVTHGYDTASRLNQVRFDSFNGTPVGYNYLSNATYHPHGAPDSLTLGNGLAEKLVYNNRMQPCRMNLKSGGAVTLSCTDGEPSGNIADFKSAFNHGAANNGSVISWIGQGAGITDFNRSFTYDELNRLKTMTGSGGPCTGLEWIYDIWGNRDEQRVTSGTCPTHNPTILTNNRIAELSYDAAGNVTADGSFTYQWDAELRLKSLNTTGAVYTYDAAGMRVRKDVGSNSTEYIYFNGQVIAERSGGGTWTDYIYAGTRLIARSDPIVVRFTNDSCSGCGGQPGGDRNLFINSITIGATTILPSDPSVSYTGAPCNGPGGMYCNGDLITTALAAGQAVTVNAYGSPDLGVYPRMQLWVNGKLMGEWDVTGTAQNYTVTTTVAGVQYYYADHLGSTRVVTNSDGAVLWSYDYMPFGEGATADYLVNRLFTGHERDAESGLDHTWFRKYSSAQGRWLSPDPLAGSVADPQSLNRYAYVLNNPVNLFDPLGLHACEEGQTHVVMTDENGVEVHDCVATVEETVTVTAPPLDPASHVTIVPHGRCFWIIAVVYGTMGGGGTIYYCPPHGASTAGAEVDPPGLRRLMEEGSWWGTAARSFVTNFALPSTAPGTCGAVFVDTVTAPLKLVRDSVQDVEDYAGPVIVGGLHNASYAATATANALWNTLFPLTHSATGNPIANPAAAATITGTIAAAGVGLQRVAQGATTLVNKSPHILLFAVNGALAYGVGKEAYAAVTGQCKP